MEMERISEIAYKNARNNPEYLKNTAKVIELGRKIIEDLGPQYPLFLEYEILTGLTEGIYAENIYVVGLHDGQKQAPKAI